MSGVDTNNNVVLDTSTIKFTFRLDNYDNRLDEEHHFDGPIKEIDTSEVGKVKYGFFYLKDYGNNPRMIILAEYGLLTAEDRANNKVSLKLAYAMLLNTVYETPGPNFHVVMEYSVYTDDNATVSFQ